MLKNALKAETPSQEDAVIGASLPFSDVARSGTNALFISRKWPPAVGGMETYCYEFTKELARHVNLKLLVLPGRLDGSTPTSVSLTTFGLRTAWQLLTKERGYQVVHGADIAIWPLVLIAKLTSPGAAAVLSAHGTDVSFGNRSGILPFLYAIYARIGARILRNARIVANSNATEKKARQLGYSHVTVVPLGSSPPERTACGDPKPFVLFVGRHFEPRKGLQWFIDRVLPLLPDDISLHVASPLRDHEDAQSLGSDRVRFLGSIQGRALNTLMAEAICVVAPNVPVADGHFEGFGLVAVETAASGGIVLASRLDGFADSVIDGETGFLLPPLDPSTWAQTITAIASWPSERRQQFIERARATSWAHFSWERVTRETLEVYADNIVQ